MKCIPRIEVFWDSPGIQVNVNNEPYGYYPPDQESLLCFMRAIASFQKKGSEIYFSDALINPASEADFRSIEGQKEDEIKSRLVIHMDNGVLLGVYSNRPLRAQIQMVDEDDLHDPERVGPYQEFKRQIESAALVEVKDEAPTVATTFKGDKP